MRGSDQPAGVVLRELRREHGGARAECERLHMLPEQVCGGLPVGTNARSGPRTCPEFTTFEAISKTGGHHESPNRCGCDGSLCRAGMGTAGVRPLFGGCAGPDVWLARDVPVGYQRPRCC